MSFGAVLPVLSLALSAAGTGLSMAGQAAQQDKQNSLVSQELARQNQYKKQAALAYQSSLAQSTPEAANQQIKQGQQDALQSYQKAQAAPLSIAPSSTGSNATSITTPDQQARAGLLNKAAAGIQGYSNFGLQQQLKDQEARNQLGVLSSISNSSGSILPYELNGAQNPYAGLASLLGAAGTATGAFGSLAGSNGVAAATKRANQTIDNSGRLLNP